MKLYVTPLGHWTGTQADAAKATREEGSKPGSWKLVNVPTDKRELTAFLNRGWQAPTAPSDPPKVKASTGTKRFRVFFKGLFAGVLLADNQAAAEAAAPGLLSVRLSRG